VELKETEIGPVPEHWEVKELGTIIEKPNYGLTASANEKNVGPKFLRITDIQEEKVFWESVPHCECGRIYHEKYSLHSGDLVVPVLALRLGRPSLLMTRMMLFLLHILYESVPKVGLTHHFCINSPRQTDTGGKSMLQRAVD
jgi:hypothetical protein